MTPVIKGVDALLTGVKIEVIVYNGQLDLICCTMGTDDWMSQLTWSGIPKFQSSAKIAIPQPSPTPYANATTGAFVKTHKTLSLYYVMTAGHMVPSDNGPMALAMLQIKTRLELQFF